MKKIMSVLKWTAIVIGAAFVLLIIVRIPHAIDADMTTRQVAKIHATKLTIDDVMGKYLPPDPGAEADKTIVGIDANKNGIRDDVELAIFKEYPNSAKTRAVLLQYALALQMETSLSVINEVTATEAAVAQSRANDCVVQSLDYIKDYNEYLKISDALFKLAETKQWDTQERRNAHKTISENVRSYNGVNKMVCDIDLLTLPN
jgi:hypothetical protein